MLNWFDLPYSDVLVFILNYGTFVVVYVEVIGRGKDCDDRGEFLSRRLAMHGISERKQLWNGSMNTK